MAEGTGREREAAGRKRPGRKRVKKDSLAIISRKKTLAYRTAPVADPSKPLPTGTARKSLQYAACKINGGPRQFVEYVRMGSATDPDVLPFLEFWDSQAEYVRERWTLDQFDHHSNVPAEKVFAAAAKAAFKYNADVSDMIAMAAMPQIVETSVKSARKEAGRNSFRDRELLLKHSGFVPLPQGSIINIQNSNQAVANAAANAGIPDFSDTITETADVVRDAWVPGDD